MIPNTLENYWIDEDINGKILEQTEILRQITQVLESFHSEGNVYGELTPSDVTLDAEKRKLLPNKRTNILANKSLAEWRPAEERINSNSDWKPTIQGDIFNLGCFFYYIITGGQHPFGSSGQRISFIANNLYDLSGCRDELLQKLIKKMISYDSAERPSCSELFRHPYLWERKKIEEYMYEKAEHIDEANNHYLKLKDLFLLSTSQPSTVKSVSDILVDIKNRQENPLNACNMFPDFLSTVILVYDSDGEIQKETNDESRPIIFKNLLIANDSFGVVGPFKKRHGRFGLQPIHVMEFPQTSTDLCEDSLSSMKRLACSTHPNLLKYFSVSEHSNENSSERFIILACEPFDETLETFMVRKKNSLDFETAKEILNQITAGLLEYHSNNLVHGNITSSQIAISNSSEKIIAKISKFPIYDKTERPAGSMQNDIRRLGRIFLDLFDEQVIVTPPLNHLIRAMKDIRDDECVPSCEAVFYHPFFWSVEEIADFLIVAMDFYKDNPNIDRTSTIVQSINSKQEFQHLKTNRSIFEYFQSQTTSDSFTEEATIALAVELTKNYPMLVIQTWLKLQKYKSMDFGMELEPFYCPTYDFPKYGEDRELRDERKHTLEGIETTCGSNKDPRVDQKDNPEKRVCKALVPISRQEEDEGYHSGSDFIIDQFSISNPAEPPERQLNKWSSEVQSGANYPIQRYLSNYVRQWEIAQEDDPNRIMNHPVIDPAGRTAMHLACHSDDFYVLAVKLFELGFSNPDVIDKNGYAPLHVAAETRAIKITQLLIEMKATIDICGKEYSITPLFFAVMSNSTPTIKLLIKNKADVTKLDGFRRSPLHYAVATNSRENVDLLLKNLKSNNPKSLREIVDAVDQDGMSPLHIAVANNLIEMVDHLLRNYNANPNVGKLDGTEFSHQREKKRPVLQLAVAMQWYDVIDLLLQAGADPNMTDCQGQTALHIAALIRPPTAESLKIVDRLIKNKDNKANVKIVNAVDHMGRTVLHAATFNEADDIVKRLLECQPHIEVDKKEKERGITPLHLAAWKNLKNITEMLINQGKARVDVRDKNGDTPLEYAASSNAIDVAELLLEAAAADPSISQNIAKSKRWNGRSPLHVAAAHNAGQVGQLLISKGADVNARDDLDLTPLHYADFRGSDQFVELLHLKDNRPPFIADPPLSKGLTSTELKSVHQLTNSFNPNIAPKIKIILPPIVAQFNDLKLQITQGLIIDGFQSNFR